LRAIEEGLPVVRVTPTGVSGFIDPRGTMLDTLPSHAAGATAMPVAAPLEPTPFARLGHAAPGIFAFLLLALGFWTNRRMI
jgi:apolipoprotein N-acyltransferase